MERGSGRSSVVSGPAILAAVLEAAVDAPARPVGAAPAAYGVYPLIILIVYVLVTGGILCSRQSEVYLLLTAMLKCKCFAGCQCQIQTHFLNAEPTMQVNY